MKSIPWSLVFGIVLCAHSWAQAVSTAQISGTVRDATGAAVPDAQIKATQTATGQVRTVTSGADGHYVLPNLPVGPYVLEVDKSGFAKYLQTGIVLEVAGNPTIDVPLKVGQLTEQVVVAANAALVETSSDSVGTVVDQQRVLELPLNGREATQLIFLSGMANTGNGTNLNTIRNYPTQLISVEGGQGNGITYLLDGGMHNDVMNSLNLPLPFPDALQEFKVESNALPAQYGFHATATVNAITKSGTNQFHGDAFEFFRNGDLNARDFFATARDSLKRNQFGGVVGGPIKKDKLFFFAGYEGTTIKSNPPQTIAYVPTPAALQGNFQVLTSPACNSGRQITLPASLGFVNNIIPASDLSPIALKIATYLPTASNQCGETTYGILSNSNEDIGVAKLDYQISAKDSFFGRIITANLSGPGSYDGTNALTFSNAPTLDRDTSVVLGDTYLISNGMVNTARATVTRTIVQKTPQQFYSWADVGVPDVTQFVPNFLEVSVSGGFTIGGANMTPSRFNTGPTIAGADDISFVHGSHQMGFGVEYIHEIMNFKSGLNTPGTFSFNGSATGLGLADFLLGDGSSFSQGDFSLGYNRQNYIGLYAQDTWRVTSHLTLSYGLRWEPYIAPFSKYGWFSNFNPSLFAAGVHSTVYPNAPAGTIFPGDPGYTAGKAAEDSTYNLWAPRLGIVWDPFGDGKTSIRAAAGIFTDRQHLFYLDAYANDAPYGDSVTTGAVPFSDPWATTTGGNPFANTALYALSPSVKFPIAAGVVTHQLNAKPTIIQQWNFNIQRQIATNWLVSVNYVGNQTTHLWTGNQGNPAVFLGLGPCTINGKSYNPCSSTANTNQRRILYLANPAQGQYYGAVTEQDTGGTANYNGLYLQLQRRLSRGVTIQGNYTWSHCISDVENTELGTAGPTYSVPFDRRLDRSNCAISDVRQILNLTTVFQTPEFSERALRAVASHWQLSTAIQVKSAQLFTVTDGTDVALDGSGTQRPNLISPDPYVPNKGPNGWLNPAAFATPPLGTITGNLGAVNLAGPGSLQFDMALSRLFPIHERITLQARFEAFNVLNTVNFSNPVATLNSPTFGKITSDISGSQTGGLVANTGDPRILQFALKLLF